MCLSRNTDEIVVSRLFHIVVDHIAMGVLSDEIQHKE